jgi:hypothetical protein
MLSVGRGQPARGYADDGPASFVDPTGSGLDLALTALAARHVRLDRAVVNIVDHWQTLIAGLVGAGAAIVAVVFALLSERRRRKQEATALRVALGAEIRQFALRAYEAHLSIGRRLEAGEPISVHQLDDDARFP